MNISVILPTYNEKDNINELIDQLNHVLFKKKLSSEIIVIDDNSPDGTGYICEKHFKSNKHVVVYIKKKGRGLANSIMYGLKKAKGEYIVVMDTDFSHSPNLIPIMLEKIKKYDVVIASRYAKNGGGENKVRYILSKVFNIYLRLMLKVNITDFLFGYFCVRRKFLVDNNLINSKIFMGFGDYFIRLAYGIDKYGGTFYEIPAYYKDRVHGKSKSNIFKMLVTYTWTSVKLLCRDLF